MGAETRLTELKLILPPTPKPMANYLTAVRHGKLLYTSGHGPLKEDGTLHLGKLGAGLGVDAGRDAARQTGLAILATVRSQLGNLDRVVRVIKVLGLVNSDPDFIDHPKVINGFSDLMVEVFGDAGRGARSAFGVAALPSGMAVEIEAIFEVKD